MKISAPTILIFLSACLSVCNPVRSLAQEKKSKEQVVVPAKAQGADYDYYAKDYFRYGDFIYSDRIKTLLAYREGFELSAPVLELGKGQKLLFSFDDLDADYKSYQFTVIHCDAWWKPSDLMQTEYMEGFWDDYIRDYHFSLNTLQPYTHYRLEFPTDNMNITKSGNYLLKVYPEGKQDQPIFTCRFWVVEPLIAVTGKIKWATNINDRYSKQEVDFVIDKSGYDMPDPYRDLKIVITQNNRWDNAINNIKPLIIRDNVLDYNLDAGNTFDGGNEFRHFDMKSLRYLTDRVRKIDKDSAGYEVWLQDDLRRTFKVYVSDNDINGRRLIKTVDYDDTDVESEYAWVHFFLPWDAPLADGNLYVSGALTLWQFSDDAKLKYNTRLRGYETNMYLKQGYYNYEYLFLPGGKNTGETGLVEGNHYETDNEYNIYVYYRDTGSLYDRLIAIKTLNTSGNQ